MKFGYARVSTAKQDLTRQITSLENAGCDEVYCDIIEKKMWYTHKERRDLLCQK